MSMPNPTRNEIAVRVGQHKLRQIGSTAIECWRLLKHRASTAVFRDERDNLVSIAALAIMALQYIDDKRRPYIERVEPIHMPASKKLAKEMTENIVRRCFPNASAAQMDTLEQELMPFADAAAYYNLVLPKVD